MNLAKVNIFLILVVLLPLRSVSAAVICGKVTQPSHSTVKLNATYFFLSNVNITENIDSNNHFRIEVELSQTYDFALRVEGLSLLLVLNPTDSVFVKISKPFLNNKERVRKYELSGSGAQLSSLVNNFYVQRSHYFDAKEVYEKNGELDFEAFKLFCDSIYKIDLNSIESIYNKSNCLEFKTWTTLSVKYFWANNKLRYWWMHPENKEIDPLSHLKYLSDEGSFGFIDSLTLSDSLLITSKVFDFLSEYVNYYQGLNREHLVSKDLNKKIQYINTYHAEGIYKDACFAKVIYEHCRQNSSVSAFVVPVINSSIRNKIIKNGLIDHCTKITRFSSDRKYAVNSYNESGADLYDTILKSNSGKLIYLDFWATWCGPCISEFKYLKELKTRFQDSLSIVSFCCQSPRSAFEHITTKNDNSHTINYYLDDEVFNFFYKKFGIKQYPFYVLIDKNGKIVSSNTFRPSNPEIIFLIEKLLQ